MFYKNIIDKQGFVGDMCLDYSSWELLVLRTMTYRYLIIYSTNSLLIKDLINLLFLELMINILFNYLIIVLINDLINISFYLSIIKVVNHFSHFEFVL